jgi:hypothetical protein
MADTSVFWSAYSSALRNRIVPGVPLPKDNEIFSLPFTVPLTTATQSLTNEEVNYLIYTVANTTLAADGSKGDYANELNTYVSTPNLTSPT